MFPSAGKGVVFLWLSLSTHVWFIHSYSSLNGCYLRGFDRRADEGWVSGLGHSARVNAPLSGVTWPLWDASGISLKSQRRGSFETPGPSRGRKLSQQTSDLREPRQTAPSWKWMHNNCCFHMNLMNNQVNITRYNYRQKLWLWLFWANGFPSCFVSAAGEKQSTYFIMSSDRG